jgi:hypothetical protein
MSLSPVLLIFGGADGSLSTTLQSISGKRMRRMWMQRGERQRAMLWAETEKQSRIIRKGRTVVAQREWGMRKKAVIHF